ncbi:amidase family protein [Burkholderia stabilis]|uniref:amidase family protein n=1 Tax=Burkholderia stabilis TaxID=95485 RepID=UPI0023EA7269|nr:amidase family protein [Burkholderia stabilis]
MHGLPIGIRISKRPAGLLTTYGSPIYRANVPAHDNTLVRRLRAAGAIVVGKPTCRNWVRVRQLQSVWGATGNPFDPRLNAGGSSGGSAAALALDLVPLASGSDTGGSLRIPAAKCGVVGLRTSPGSCRAIASRLAGRRLRWSGRWDAPSKTPGCNSRRRSVSRAPIRSAIRSR